MTNKVMYIFIFLFGVFISSCSQILLKKSANNTHKNKIKEYMNLKVIIAYMMFFSATILNTIAFKVIPLSFGPVLESTSYIYITILSYFLLKEKISKKKIEGILIIMLGIFVYTVL